MPINDFADERRDAYDEIRNYWAKRSVRGLGFCCLAVVSVLGVPMSSRAEVPPLDSSRHPVREPREGQPPALARRGPAGWIAPDKKNVLQVWVKTIGKDDDKIVTADPKRGIRQFFWAENSKQLVYMQDSDGDENFHLFGVELASGNVRDLTPFQGVKAQTTAVDPNFPDTILVVLNLRNRALFDVYRLDLNSGALVLDTVNPATSWAGWPTPSCRSSRPRRRLRTEGLSSAFATILPRPSAPGSRPGRRTP